MASKSSLYEFTKGVFAQNPIFTLVLGLCPTLAVTTSVENALGMGAATFFVLVSSSLLVSVFKEKIPRQIRIPVFILIIATFVTVAELYMAAYAPALSSRLGIFIPLIVVNCIVLGRVEAFASKKPVSLSILDAAGMGAGFILALLVLGFVRELLGTGSIVFAGSTLMSLPIAGASAMIISPGAFLTLGLLLGASKRFRRFMK
ncbi:MAG: electron transport complex subunit RsxE [Candidatus Altiarchaeota archaeon]